MARRWNQLSIPTRSALIAAGAALGTMGGRFAGGCLSEHGACTLNNPPMLMLGAAMFAGAWTIVAAALWAVERHRQNNPGHETR